MQAGGYVTQPDPRNLLNLSNDDEMLRALEQTGAMNSVPPLQRSSHLKNIQTGRVLPWNPLLAEQRDIMVNCDEHGNTDPEAWQSTVTDDDAARTEQEALYWEARQAIVSQAMQMATPYKASNMETTIPSGKSGVPDDVQPYHDYTDALDALKKQLEY